MRKICVITGTRAEYGLLYWIIKEIENTVGLELQLVVTGMHLSPEFGLTYQEIEKDYTITKKIEMVLSSDTSIGISKSMGLAMISFSEVYAELQPDIIVVLGDRYEIFAAVSAAMISRIPVAHIAGGEATDIVLSRWIVLMTFLLTLFLSFAKRRDDVLRMNETGEAPRQNTSRYNLTFINEAITITASVTLVCYIMYTVSPEVVANFHSDYLYLTSVFVLLGLLRYIQLAVVDKKSGDPTKVILHDRFTQLIVLGWLISFLLIIYFIK